MSILASLGIGAGVSLVKKLLLGKAADTDVSGKGNTIMTYIIVALLVAIPVAGLVGYFKGVGKANERIRQYVDKKNADTAKKVEKQVIIQKEVETVYRDRIQYVDRVRYVNQETVKLVPDVQVVEGKPVIPIGAINLFNNAALNKPTTVEQAQDATPSVVGLPLIIGTAAENFSIAHGREARIRAWEEWYERSYKNWTGKAVPSEYRYKPPTTGGN